MGTFAYPFLSQHLEPCRQEQEKKRSARSSTATGLTAGEKLDMVSPNPSSNRGPPAAAKILTQLPAAARRAS